MNLQTNRALVELTAELQGPHADATRSRLLNSLAVIETNFQSAPIGTPEEKARKEAMGRVLAMARAILAEPSFRPVST